MSISAISSGSQALVRQLTPAAQPVVTPVAPVTPRQTPDRGPAVVVDLTTSDQESAQFPPPPSGVAGTQANTGVAPPPPPPAQPSSSTGPQASSPDGASPRSAGAAPPPPPPPPPQQAQVQAEVQGVASQVPGAISANLSTQAGIDAARIQVESAVNTAASEADRKAATPRGITSQDMSVSAPASMVGEPVLRSAGIFTPYNAAAVTQSYGSTLPRGNSVNMVA